MTEPRDIKVSSDITPTTQARLREIKSSTGRSLGTVIARAVMTDAIVSALREMVCELSDYVCCNEGDGSTELRTACEKLVDVIDEAA